VTACVGEKSSGAAVIQAAWTEALHRGCDLKLFHAYRERQEEAPGQGPRRAAELVARAIAAADIALSERSSVVIGHDDPVAALIGQARDAELLVIGGRPGALPHLVRTSAGIIGSLNCPLLIIPEPVPDPWTRRSVAQVDRRAEPAVRR
jgi:nucleotide-binding universal stress UspA family protein